jgi:hypothetical protein
MWQVGLCNMLGKPEILDGVMKLLPRQPPHLPHPSEGTTPSLYALSHGGKGHGVGNTYRVRGAQFQPFAEPNCTLLLPIPPFQSWWQMADLLNRFANCGSETPSQQKSETYPTCRPFSPARLVAYMFMRTTASCANPVLQPPTECENYELRWPAWGEFDVFQQVS